MSKTLKVAAIGFTSAIFAGLCFWLSGALTQCQGVGLGGVECNGPVALSLILYPVGFVGAIVLAALLYKKISFPHPWKLAVLSTVITGILAVIIFEWVASSEWYTLLDPASAHKWILLIGTAFVFVYVLVSSVMYRLLRR